MFTCPNCKTALVRRKSPVLGLVWICPCCQGRAMSVELLRKGVPQPLVNRLWQQARSGQYSASRPCPVCRRWMIEVPIVPMGDQTLHLDVCTGCHFLWFDPQEFEALPRISPRPAEKEPLSREAQEALALARIEILKEQARLSGVDNDAPENWLQLAAALCGIPVEYNDAPLKNWPLVTWLLAAMIAGVSIAAWGDLEAAVTEWGLIPAVFGRRFGLTFMTSFFLHAGLFHLIGNLCFLIVFGDNTEDVLGKRRYVLLVAVAALVGDIAHILSDPRATIPCVGASGGISGILAYYCLRFPKASIGFIWWFRWFRLPVGVMFALWVATQIMNSFWVLPEIGGVAVFAHLGGAAVGVLFWWLTRSGSAGDDATESSPLLKSLRE